MAIILVTLKSFLGAKNSGELIFNRLIRTIIYLGVFLTPVFFISFGSNFIEYSKVLLFYALIVALIILWLVKIFWLKKINWQFKLLDVPIIILLITYLLACLFSVDRDNSFFGKNLMSGNSGLTFIFFFIFYVFISRFITKTKQALMVFYSLIGAVFLNVVLLLVGFVWQNKFIAFTLTINTFNFLLLLSLGAAGIIMVLTAYKVKIMAILWFVIALVSLFLIDNQAVLLILALAIFVFIILLSFRSTYFSNKVVIGLTAVLFLTVLALVLPIASYTGIISPVALNLPVEFGYQISKASFGNSFLLGVGPQNFIYNFYQYKPLALNDTSLWSLGFVKSSNFWLEILNTVGILGVIVFFALFLKYFYSLIRYIRKSDLSQDKYYNKFLVNIGLAALLFAFLAQGFFDNFDFVLLFFFFLFIGLAVGLRKTKNQIKTITNKSWISLFFYTGCLIVLVFSYFQAKLVQADINIVRAENLVYTSAYDFELGQAYYNQAIESIPWRSNYQLLLADVLVRQDQFLTAAKETYDQDNLQKEILESVNNFSSSQPQGIEDLYLLNKVYTGLAQSGFEVSQGQEETNAKLIKLDANNPELYVDRALLNFNKYQLIKAQGAVEVGQEKQITSLISAIEADLKKSISLKRNYVLGYYNLALFYQEFGDQDSALVNMAKAFELDPSQKILALDLKKLYLNQDKVAEAKDVLINYLQINSQDIQMRLELAKLLQQSNDSAGAKVELENILQQEPDNQTAKDLLSQIK